MKYYSIFVDRHHSQEGAYGFKDSFDSKLSLEEVKAILIETLLEDHYGIELSENDTKELFNLSQSKSEDYITLSIDDTNYTIWVLKNGNLAFDQADSPCTADKYETRLVAVSYEKELIKTIKFQAVKKEELPPSLQDAKIDVGLFKYEDGNIKLEAL